MNHDTAKPLDANLAAIIGLLAVQRNKEAAELAVKNRVMVTVMLELDCLGHQPNVRRKLEFGVGFIPQNGQSGITRLFDGLPEDIVDHLAISLDYQTECEVREADELREANDAA
jgi:hypothetical protein